MSILRKSLPALILLVLGVLLALQLVPQELEQMKYEVPGMPDSYPIEQKCRPAFLLLLCALPCIGALVYAFMGTMARYVSRCFITYFLMCTLILLLIYVMADFTENIERFRTRFDDPVLQSLKFYGTQLPMLLYQILPYTLLMGTLWCLSKLSGSCELTGMLQSGRSLMRVCRPIFIFSCIVALAYGIFGFHWAPNGSLYRQVMLKQERAADGSAPALVYRNDSTARIWRVERPPFISNPGEPMRGVIIEQFDTEKRGRLLTQYHADTAEWNKADATWTLHNAYVRTMAAPGAEPGDDAHSDTLIVDFAEKPYQIISPSQSDRIDSMGTSALYEQIKEGADSQEGLNRKRTEWHVRIARIFSCLVLVLLAVPSAVTFQRRGAMKGIGTAILLAALMLFLYRVFPSLGESGLLPAWLSAWIPNILYLCIALYLFRINLAHRSFREWCAAKLAGKP